MGLGKQQGAAGTAAIDMAKTIKSEFIVEVLEKARTKVDTYDKWFGKGAPPARYPLQLGKSRNCLGMAIADALDAKPGWGGMIEPFLVKAMDMKVGALVYGNDKVWTHPEMLAFLDERIAHWKMQCQSSTV